MAQKELKKFLEETIEGLGLSDGSVEFDEESRRFSVVVDEGDWFKKWLPDLVRHLKHLLDIVARKQGDETRYYVDINNYRRERERIIIELAQAAAKKAVFEKNMVPLPAMNAYERRLVHMELSMRPDLETESAGEGRDRHVVVKPAGSF